MLSRQAIWCQCASVLHIVFALTCMVSFQSSFIEMNILWCFLFGSSGLVHFICGEHGPAFGISIDKWLRIEKYLEYVSVASLFLWNISIESFFTRITLTCVLALALSKIKNIYSWPFVSLWVFIYVPNTFKCVPIIFCTSKLFSEYYFKNIYQKSSKSTELKLAYACHAIYIMSEALMLWQLRCMHRFPGTIRWKSVIMGLMSVFASCLYGYYYCLPTILSSNAIVISGGHRMAASLVAAQKCPICKRYLQTLDMESSFSDGF